MARKQKPYPQDMIDDDTQPNNTNSRRRIVVLLWLVALILTWTLAGVAALVLQRPDVLGLATFDNLTATHLIFDQTRQALDQQRLNNDSTSIALSNREQRIQQSQTQLAIDAQASQTADALVNAQQGTQAALNYQSTEAVVQRAATQIELNYRSTEAALNREATANALGFGTQSPPVIGGDVVILNDLSNGQWHSSNLQDWQFNADGLWGALRNDVWLLSNEMTLTDYAFDVTIMPYDNAVADYYVLLNAPNGLALRLTYNAGNLQQVGLLLMTYEQLQNGLSGVSLPLVYNADMLLSVGTTLIVHVDMQNNHLIATVNGTTVIDMVLEVPIPVGGVGVHVPQGTTIQDMSFHSINP